MSKRGRPKKKYPSLGELPDGLRLEIAKIMAQFNISDIGEAYDRAALLLDPNSKKFERLVNVEAERRHRSKFFTAMNKARATIEKNARELGRSLGFRRGKSQYRIWGYCCVCGDEFEISPNSDAHKEIIRHLKERRWGHGACVK